MKQIIQNTVSIACCYLAKYLGFLAIAIAFAFVEALGVSIYAMRVGNMDLSNGILRLAFALAYPSLVFLAIMSPALRYLGEDLRKKNQKRF